MILRMVDRFRRRPTRRALAGWPPSAAALAALVCAAGAHAEAPLPCNRIAKVLATGTVADRNALAAHYPVPASDVVRQCRADLKRGFGSTVRPHLAKPDHRAWRQENQWLAGFLLTLRPEEAGGWVRSLDTETVAPEALQALVAHWSQGTTAGTGAVFYLIDKLQPQTERARALMQIEPLLLTLEADSVTAATHMRSEVERLGFPALFADAELTALWSLRAAPESDRALTAFAVLGAGDEARAFRAFAEAAKEEPAYWIHAAVLADRLFAKKALDPAALLPLRIEYRRCGEGYRVEWAFGTLGKLQERALPPEFAAESALRKAFRCGEIIEETTDPGRLKDTYLRWRHRFAGTRAEARYRLDSLEAMAGVADKLSREGRLIQGNELRAFIYQETVNERPYAFLGGVTKARALRDRVRSHLAFPPEPEVFVNDPRR